MTYNKILKIIHISGMAWLIIASVFLIILALNQAGMNWWIIFSLSGYSTTMILFAVIIYAFAIFRGVSRSRAIEVEHPLTSSKSYCAVYDAAPFIGLIAAASTFGVMETPAEKIVSLATASLISTFLVWILFDPLISVVETLLPQCRKHRNERITKYRNLKYAQEQNNKRLLETLLEQEEQNRKERQKKIDPLAEELVNLLKDYDYRKNENIEGRVIEIGAKAWRFGGIDCMRQLHETASGIQNKNKHQNNKTDLILKWWDGIGSWQKPRIV